MQLVQSVCPQETGDLHNHFTDNKLNDDYYINDMTVDIGLNKDWSITDFKED
jgi:hypothetical protein